HQVDVNSARNAPVQHPVAPVRFPKDNVFPTDAIENHKNRDRDRDIKCSLEQRPASLMSRYFPEEK
ncbi:hypothetical protein VU13_05805, partial [Desulfobulbus sp. US5]|nr:hypothetical protein [Desulfobulbus sp. US5]